jgi:hypothetical protein
VTDFGRTGALVGSARATAEAQADIATLTRAQVRLNVREAFYQVLGAEAVLRAARAALNNRALVTRQLSALAQSELKSTLDVDFAKVLQSEAELAVVFAPYFVALTVLPLFCARFIKSAHGDFVHESAEDEEVVPAEPTSNKLGLWARFDSKFAVGFYRLLHYYDRVVACVLDAPKATLGGFGVLFC